MIDCHDKTLSLWRKKENRTMARRNIDLFVVLHDDSDYKDWQNIPQAAEVLPKDFKSSMPTIEELEKELKDNRE